MTRARRGLACAVALLWAVCCGLPAGADGASIIVRRDPGLSAGQRAQLRADAGVRHVRALALPDAELVSVPAGAQDRALAALNADPHVLYAAPDVLVHADAAEVPNDPLFAPAPPFRGQWQLDHAKDEDGDADLDMLQAWDGPNGAGADGRGVDVAVVDQRVDITHPDLHIAPGAGKDFVAEDTTRPGCDRAAPVVDHGTHVAGIIGATRGNGKGIAGIASGANVIPVRALDNCGEAPLDRVIDAFKWAAGHASIVSASFSTDPLLDPDYGANVQQMFRDVFDDPAYEHTLFVVAAGNEGNDNNRLPVYPCSTKEPWGTSPDNLVCVGMTDSTDKPVCSGNVGVDVFAPGVEVWSTVAPDGYARMSGTSTSTPIVAAVAALVKGLHPGMEPAELKSTLVSSVDAIDGMPDEGRLNAAKAIGIARPGGSGGAGGAWASCDKDHDTVLDSADDCGEQPGPRALGGCPDSDGDGLRDIDDNCPHADNLGQEDADGDGIGDACDATPRGDDVDHDNRFGAEDRCPTQPAATPDGCPPVIVNPPPVVGGGTLTPVAPPVAQPAPRLVSVAVKVTPRKCARGKRCKKAAKVTVRVSRQARVALRFEHRVRKHGRWSWRRVTTRSVLASARGKSLTVRTLRKGRYRVVASLAGATEACRFKV